MEEGFARGAAFAQFLAEALPIISPPPGFEWIPEDSWVVETAGVQRLLVPVGGIDKVAAENDRITIVVVLFRNDALFDMSLNCFAARAYDKQREACSHIVHANMAAMKAQPS